MIKKISKSTLFLIVIFISACSMPMAPNINSYQFKKGGEIRIAPALGGGKAAEIQLAASLSKNLFISGGTRYQNKDQFLGLYTDYMKYSSFNMGFGYYASRYKREYFQIAAEYIGASSYLGRVQDHTSFVSYDYQYMRYNGPVINAVYTYTVHFNNIIGAGIRVGELDYRVTNKGGDPFDPQDIGIERKVIDGYLEACFSYSHIFRNNGVLGFNMGFAGGYSNLSMFFARMSFQLPIDLNRLKRKANN